MSFETISVCADSLNARCLLDFVAMEWTNTRADKILGLLKEVLRFLGFFRYFSAFQFLASYGF